jgi:hypothetical protein
VSSRLLLVGSIPLDTPEDVFRLNDHLEPLKSPRGENGG